VKALAGMELLRRGSRLSVQPVTAVQFRTIVALASKRLAARP
jgi:predicted RNA-binding protein with PUA-like domain